MKNTWDPWVHSFYRQLYQEKMQGRRFLLAVSGGMDSMVLFELFHQVASSLKISFSVAYVHHGPSDSVDQENYRNLCQQLVQDQCLAKSVPFVTFRSGEVLKSEEAMRDFRYQKLFEVVKKDAFDFLVTAHHADDLLETRILKLLRGCGPQGLVAMQVLQGALFRPLLNSSRQEIEKWAKKQNVSFVEDPSNQDSRYLRNWLRHEWLPLLDQRQKGMKTCLARSLDNLSHSADSDSWQKILDSQKKNQFKISSYFGLSVKEQQRFLAYFIQKQGIKGLRRGQIEEIQKHLDKNQKHHMFEAASLSWNVIEGRVEVSRVETSVG